MTQIPQAAAEAFETAHDIMASIRAVKGKEYCYTVETALCCLKLRDLTSTLLERLQTIGEIEEEHHRELFMGTGMLFAKIISLNRIAGGASVEGTQEEAAEIMNWAEKVYEMEHRGVENLRPEQ